MSCGGWTLGCKSIGLRSLKSSWQGMSDWQTLSWYALSASSACPQPSPIISDSVRLHSGVTPMHTVSSHNHTTPVAGLNSDQCLISPDLVPMSQPATYLSFSHMLHLPDAFSLMITGNHASLVYLRLSMLPVCYIYSRTWAH